jgi:hypothetical protein
LRIRNSYFLVWKERGIPKYEELIYVRSQGVVNLIPHT